jgi:nicotinate-nucleotide adenylyltransferase
MNIALFGGTFDPIHRGHIEVARAAARRFNLKEVRFVPASAPPHKQGQPYSDYAHRYAMVALATADERGFVPSLLEAPEEGRDASYSVETVRRVLATLGKSDRLFFIIGIDAFLEIATWREPDELLRLAEFIVASRPGFSMADLAAALPESIRPNEKVRKAFARRPAKTGTLALGGVTLHVLDEVRVPLSSTRIRAAAAQGRNLARDVGPAVAAYIKKTHLYRDKKPRRPARKHAVGKGLKLVKR